MGTSLVDRTLLAAGYLLLAAGCVGWWLSGIAGSDPTPGASVIAVWLAGGILLLATRWRWGRPRMAPLPSATGLAIAAPLAVEPIAAIGSGPAIGVAYVAATLAALPLGWLLTSALPERSARRLARAALLVCLGSGLLLAAIAGLGMSWRAVIVGPGELWWLAVTMAMLIAAAGAALGTAKEAFGPSGTGMVAALGYLGLAVTASASSFALAVPWWPAIVVPALVAAATVAVLARFAIQPLAAEVGTSHVERDIIISTLESERGRIASTIHDGPLGDLALLVQRLDASGDVRSAALARSIAGDLRSLGNELRLPILEDLGAGPAIEWLAGRVMERTQVAIDTDLRAQSGRPPAPVELAVFRVAQEALLNAAKHGRGPITIRYAGAPSAASLSVTDAGPGITPVARSRAHGEGHLGLRLMAQRAEAIGARLDVAAVPSGGTQVRLEWAGP